ncbi:hypothetical protein H6F90_00265 [Trichocoleus sp. FACHB-591]|uniref:hypothetical protein n=1 Tax=Trichocoleus sp. FACHB-591 TaxID=2692872 RepID=UPI00168409E1|nr:hypothetical protein [Trichocoleus sp. FACHB-591]MBD2093588.1 hypothetical protein [Trichocoleus sp. FACHB-591]
MPEVFLVQPSRAKISNRTICATIPKKVPLPAFSLFEEVPIAPDVVAIVVGLEYCSAQRSETIYEHPDNQGWWCHIFWKFEVDNKRNRQRADYMGHIHTEGYLRRLAREYQQSQQAQAAEPELLPIAS